MKNEINKISLTESQSVIRRLSDPVPIGELLQMNIPPVEFYADGLLQKQGRLMLSSATNLGKSNFIQNLALSLALGKSMFLDKFKLQPARVLYIDFEMGLSPMRERFVKMLSGIEPPENLLVHTVFGFDLLKLFDDDDDDEFFNGDDDNEDEDIYYTGYQNKFEEWIALNNIQVVIIDPLSAAWFGNENSKEEARKITATLDTLIGRYGVSVILIHHWRKSTKDAKRGGEMASGSAQWVNWTDTHITLEGKPDYLTVSCEKSRNCARFEAFRVKLNPDTLWFEYQGEYSVQFTERDLEKVFITFDRQWVAIPELTERAEELGICSRNTIRSLLRTAEGFWVDKSKKTHYVGRTVDHYNRLNVPNEGLA